MAEKEMIARGIIVALVTPMDDTEKLNEAELRKQVRRMIETGLHGIFCLGTNGEFYALRHDEKLDLVRIVTDECGGRLPVYAGTGCITTADTVELTKEMEELGVDGLSVITPYFVGMGQDELYEHYRTVAEATNLPLILYNIPGRAGNAIAPGTAARLAEIDNIIGIKDSSGNFDNTLLYLEETPEGFRVLSGNDSLVLPTLMAGGTGGVCGMANLIPEIMVSIYELWHRGDQVEATKVQRSIRPLRNLLNLGNPNSVVKRIMNLMGHPVGPARRPVAGESGKLDDEIKRVLALYK